MNDTDETPGGQQHVDEAVVERHVKALMEHFDTVQVFATRYDPKTGGTVGCNKGRGNWYARVGHVKDWVNQQDTSTAVDVQNRADNEE